MDTVYAVHASLQPIGQRAFLELNWTGPAVLLLLRETIGHHLTRDSESYSRGRVSEREEEQRYLKNSVDRTIYGGAVSEIMWAFLWLSGLSDFG